MRWQINGESGTIVAGQNGSGSALNQLRSPNGITIDRKNNLYIVDTGNERIICYKEKSNSGQVVADKSGQENDPWTPYDLDFNQTQDVI